MARVRETMSRWVSWLVFGLLSPLAIACAADTERPSSSDATGKTPASTDDSAADDTEEPPTDVVAPVASTPDEPCTDAEDGVVEECKVDLPERAGIKNCFEGVRLCDEGAWTPCSRPEIIEEALDEREARLATSD